MCTSIDLGGKCCTGHTRPRYDDLLSAMEATASKNPFNHGDGRKKARQKFTAQTDNGPVNALNVVADYASTGPGAKQVAADIVRFKSMNDSATAAFLASAARAGRARATAAAEATAAIKKAKEQALRKITGSRCELKRSAKATPEWNMQAIFPGVAERWDVEKNKGILPTEVTPNVNGSIWLRCPEGHSWDGGRGNNVVAPIRKGKRHYPICPECEGRRPRLFAATQAEYGTLAEAIGDTDAWNRLSPALQYQCLNEMGLLRGSATSMSRQVGMSIVHGDLTLTDMIAATDANKISVREDLDDDQTVATLTDLRLDIDPTESSARTRSTDKACDELLAATGTLTLINPEGDLARDIAREINDGFWKHACDPSTDLDTYTAYLTVRRGYNAQRDAAIDRFLAELDTVVTTDLPDGYTPVRTDADGTVRTITPTLAQRRFAATVTDRRRYANWSGTGAGKTLSAALAVHATGASNTLVVCPNAVTEQWADEFRASFPTTTDVRMGLPTTDSLDTPPTPGTNRVWVVNYDKFQGDPTALHAILTPYAETVDAIVFDEIQMAKASTAADTSKRRKALVTFTDRAGAANDDLVVIGMSATPVINDLDEAKSVLRLIEGPEQFTTFPTKATMKNAATAHRRLAAAGTRHLPVYPSALERREVTVDITANLTHIHAHVEALRENGETNQTHPAMMERALLTYKIPAVVAEVTANKALDQGPTLIYTYYTTGMVAPMVEALEAAGLRVATFIGTDTDAEKADALRRFKAGEIDALIGSRPIATGVDGLQHAASNLLVVSTAWTAADDDQLIGRLQRRGQMRDVRVTYLIAEAVVGKVAWSWCRTRLARVQFKRGLADAAVDGVLPDGALDSGHQGAEKAMNDLRGIVNLTLAA